MYLLSITAGLCIAYLILCAFFPYFFTGHLRRLPARAFLSLAIIIVLSLIGYKLAMEASDLEWGNRFLHAWGGGFLGFFICFLAVRDTKIEITRFRFWVMASLIVTSLGVANEIIEFFLQNYGGMVFLRTTNDTWLDLISNTAGIAIASAVLVPFIRRKNPAPQTTYTSS